ncbi:hypothetical protein JZ751_021992, partial [Albula glossodonta]
MEMNLRCYTGEWHGEPRARAQSGRGGTDIENSDTTKPQDPGQKQRSDLRFTPCQRSSPQQRIAASCRVGTPRLDLSTNHHPQTLIRLTPTLPSVQLAAREAESDSLELCLGAAPRISALPLRRCLVSV